ncbi:hypothetical protein [Halobellus salinisoli]|uniref:hypothetical protein n=1 Tax=Halobellus salinisoli TaxID=3108500 RepID=UPI003009232C
MSKSCSPSPSTSDAEWTVRQVAQVSDWDSTTDTCPACGGRVDLSEAHYQVQLDRERTPASGEKLTHERRLLAFCDADCADTWLDSDANR